MNEYSILYEDADMIVADKLTPIPVQPEKTGGPSLQDLLSAFLAERDGAKPEYLEAVHRIDRRSSGAVIFARTKKAAGALSEALRLAKVEKTYLAVVDKAPEPPEGRLEHWLLWDARKDKSFISAEGVKDAKKATLSYRVSGRSEARSKLIIRRRLATPYPFPQRIDKSPAQRHADHIPRHAALHSFCR